MADDWGKSLDDGAEIKDQWNTGEEFGFSTDDMNKDDLSRGGRVDIPGWYHLEVTKVTPDLRNVNSNGEDQMPKFTVDSTVVHEVTGQSKKGGKVTEYLFLGGKGGGPAPDWARQKVVRFLLGTGIMSENSEGKLVDSKTGKTELTPKTFEGLEGRHYVAKLVDSKQDEKDEKKYGKKCEIFFCRAYDPRDPAVKDVVKDEASLELAGYKMSEPPTFQWDAAEVAEEEGGGGDVPEDLDAL